MQRICGKPEIKTQQNRQELWNILGLIALCSVNGIWTQNHAESWITQNGTNSRKLRQLLDSQICTKLHSKGVEITLTDRVPGMVICKRVYNSIINKNLS